MSDAAAAPSREVRLRRLAIRCWRRGTKEMDLLMGGFFDAHAAGLDEAGLETFEALVEVDDTELYAWITGAAPAPSRFEALITRIAASPARAR